MENPVAIYALTRTDGNEVLTLKEQHIYGSQRLGLQARDLVLYNLPAGAGVPESGSTAVVDGGEKGIVVTELWARSPLGDTDLGKMVSLGNIAPRRISRPCES
ncbi:MAG: hypothetical protein AAGN35_17330 [Bacteroidota bacterium]